MRSALYRDLSKGFQSVFKRVSEKTTENSEWLGRQARPGQYMDNTFKYYGLIEKGRKASFPLVKELSNNSGN